MKYSEVQNKVRIILAVLVFVFATTANAQRVELGVRYMPTFTSFKLNTSSGGTVDGQATMGYGVGGFLGFNFTSHVGVQVEVIYNTLSQSYKEADVNRDFTLKYINIPFLLSLNTGKSKPINLNFVAGPQIGLNVGSSMTSTGGDGTSTKHAVLNVKKNDLGVAYGAGIDFGLGASGGIRLGLGYRGVMGLIDISDNQNTIINDSYYVFSRTKITTNSVYVGVSILF